MLNFDIDQGDGMQLFTSICTIILCIISVIGIHELGHALAAKIFGVRVRKISLGFGKTLFRWVSTKGYIVELNILLIGGRVHLFNTRTEPVAEKLYPECFDKQPIWIRTIILLSGSLANAFAAFLALVFMFMLGFNQLQPIVAKVQPGSNADDAGIKPNTAITSVANHDTKYFRDVAMQLIMHVGQKDVEITTCESADNCHKSLINLDIWDSNSKNTEIFSAIGFTPMQVTDNEVYVPGVGFGKAIKEAALQMATLTCFFLVMVKQILTSAIPFAALLGPFKFFEAIISSFAQGLATFLYFMANFNLSMAIANLLPIPTLDGGSIIYGFIEKIRGKPMSIALETLIYQLVFIAFAIFIVQLLVNDLKYYF